MSIKAAQQIFICCHLYKLKNQEGLRRTQEQIFTVKKSNIHYFYLSLFTSEEISFIIGDKL